VYDKTSEGSQRYINLTVKAFGSVAERVRNMKLDAGSHVNIIGRYDEDSWEDPETRAKKTFSVVIADEIEFSNSQRPENGNGKTYSEQKQKPAASEDYETDYPETQPMPSKFTGFVGFSGTNPYFPEI
jgi:single-stranded DNA-binding protein